jgi:hypothetical protein
MKAFLSAAMNEHKDGNTRKVKRFANAFSKVVRSIVDVLGERPFHIRGPLNAAVLDCVMTVAIENPARIDKDFARAFKKLIDDSDFLRLTQLGTTDTLTLRERHELAKGKLIG